MEQAKIFLTEFFVLRMAVPWTRFYSHPSPYLQNSAMLSTNIYQPQWATKAFVNKQTKFSVEPWYIKEIDARVP